MQIMKKRSPTSPVECENDLIVYLPSECCLDGDDLGCGETMFEFRAYVFSEDAACRAGGCGW